ncbi:MAG: dihydropteroate synthase [Desulfovibrio sp.]|jgi:dihydropteroate synthase|nr:dihydropteroate synthase [Desulfovibrio sp.]
MPPASFKQHISWRITGNRRISSSSFFIAGIVNITPDSFSDGGRYYTPADALKRVRQVADEGADIVDLGAESTRPGARDIGHAEEWRRLQPVLEGALALRASLSSAPVRADDASGNPPLVVSVDTFRAETAARALAGGRVAPKEGADIINDVSGGAFDPAMADVLAEFKPGYVLGHSRGKPAVMQLSPYYDDVVDALLHWFTTRMTALVKAGLPEDCICLDPCIGFGKRLEHHLAICAALPRFACLGRPLYFGVSRKSFLASLLNGPPDASAVPPGNPHPTQHAKDVATQVVISLLANAGVAVHRVHRVADTVATRNILRNMGKYCEYKKCG